MGQESADFTSLFKNFEECVEPKEATITGSIPDWVSGTLLRNGPGMFTIGPDRYRHLFDGMALIQRFHIEHGKVWYNTKFLRSESYKTNMAANRIVVSEFGTAGCPDPCKSIFNRYFSYFFTSQLTDNDVVNFIQNGDEIYATSETATLNRIDPQSLDTLEYVNMRDYIAVNTATAHPHYDREGNVYNMGSTMGTYAIIKVPPPQPDSKVTSLAKAEIAAHIPMSNWSPSYYHSFGMSKNYIIFPEMPLVLNLLKLATCKFRSANFASSFEWYPEMQTVLHVVDVKSGEKNPIKYVSKPFFTFHHINAFEENGCLYVDMCQYESGEMVTNLVLDDYESLLRSTLAPIAYRYVFPLIIPEGATTEEDLLAKMEVKTSGKAVLKEDGSVFLEPEQLTEEGFEFPRLNYEDVNARPYRFLYGTGATDGEIFGNKMHKFDLRERKTETWTTKNTMEIAGEPVFVKRPGSTEEDDGVVLFPVSCAKQSQKDYLVVMDARSWTEMARAHIDAKLPVSFHAHYLEKKET